MPESSVANSGQSQRSATSVEQPSASPSQEQLQQSALRAQSRGLWTDAAESPPGETNQPKGDKLPRAVASTTSIAPPADPANTNYLTPSIGATGSGADAADGLAVSSRPSVRTAVQDNNEPTTAEAEVALTDHLPTPVVDAPEEPLLKDAQAPIRAEVQTASAARQAASAQSESSRGLLIALIFIAAAVAMLFVGAALGLWSLPWFSATEPPAARSALPAAAAAATTPVARVGTQEPAAPQAPIQAVAEESPDDTEGDLAALAEDMPGALAEEDTEPTEGDEAAEQAEAEDAEDPPSDDIAQVLSDARSALRGGDAAGAEAMLKPLLSAHPDDHHVAEVMAQALLARGAAARALPLAQRIVRKRPKRASYRVLLGDALRRTGKEASARAAYREALALDPNRADAQRRLDKL